jgi:hypothetical protein
MVTKGYQKGVYKWGTLGISGGTGGSGLPSGKALFGGEELQCNLPAALWREVGSRCATGSRKNNI